MFKTLVRKIEVSDSERFCFGVCV